jgi:hypothetical protein
MNKIESRDVLSAQQSAVKFLLNHNVAAPWWVSSMNSKGGRSASAMAMTTLCLIPPEKLMG